MLRIGVVTIFPEMFDALIDFGISGRAIREGIEVRGDARLRQRGAVQLGRHHQFGRKRGEILGGHVAPIRRRNAAAAA